MRKKTILFCIKNVLTVFKNILVALKDSLLKQVTLSGLLYRIMTLAKKKKSMVKLPLPHFLPPRNVKILKITINW